MIPKMKIYIYKVFSEYLTAVTERNKYCYHKNGKILKSLHTSVNTSHKISNAFKIFTNNPTHWNVLDQKSLVVIGLRFLNYSDFDHIIFLFFCNSIPSSGCVALYGVNPIKRKW